MSRYAVKPFEKKEKAMHVDRFRGLDAGSLVAGQLTDAHNVHILAGGALHSLPDEAKIPLENSAPLGGIYTLCSEYDPAYETPVTPDWIHANLCPADVLGYNAGLNTTARIFVADVGMPPKVNGGYRRVLSAFAEGGYTYIFYDAVYNIIDQRRYEEYEKVGSGIVANFYTDDADEGYYTAVCTLSQLWLDRIDRGGNVESMLVSASIAEHKRLSSTYERATMVQKGDGDFHYVSTDWMPSLGAAYTGKPDKVYTDIYPKLASGYAASSAYADCTRGAVRCYNRTAGEGVFGALGEKLLLLPDMQILGRADGKPTLTDVSGAVPKMTAAVQHFDRLFGIYGSHLYASAAGNCADFTEAADNLPATAAWHTVTPDGGGFTAILSFDGQVVVFTENSMLTVRGSALPFSLSYVGAYGCPSQDAAVTLGDWLYFATDGDILRYNGSRVESIGQGLPRDFVLADARLSVSDGRIAVRLIEFDGVYFYDPQSESWSTRRSAYPEAFAGDILLSAGVPYRMTAAYGDFSAAISLGCDTRRRITSLTLTAHLAPQSVLCVTDAAGNILLQMDEVYGDTVTRTAAVHTLYRESEPLLLRGSGEVILYGITLRYAPLRER